VIDSDSLDYEIVKALDRRRLDFYRPYAKQLLFHSTGAMKIPGTDAFLQERLLMAGNQLGKTMSAGAETAMHVTGLYPAWWNGRRFPHAVSCWAAGPTSQSTRDTVQKMLMGDPLEWGSGMIPGRLIHEIKRATHGVSDAIESVVVKHTSGKFSRLLFKTYDQGEIRWRGATVDFIWCDEEPPEKVYDEARVRIQVKKGFVMITFTPLLGMTEVIDRFIRKKPAGSIIVKMGIQDAEHYTVEERARLIAGYAEHEREARANGDPVMGSGKVFPIDKQLIAECPIQIPSFWPRIAGMDIGWDHPTAVAWMAWDRDVDTVHVYDIHRLKEQTAIVHAAAIRNRGLWIPMAWPHDGHQTDKGSGATVANQYRQLGVNMLKNHATHPPSRGEKEGTGGYSLEGGISEMLMRMQTGRLKIASHLTEWFEEFDLYYRKEGLIVKKTDDLMSATRAGIMMLRHAKVRIEKQDAPNHPEYVQFDSGMGVLG
jgi:phage terminase large subunit-like protein